MLLKPITPNKFLKIKTDADIPYQVTQEINAQLNFVTCLRSSNYYTIDDNVYSQGYIELDRVPSSASTVEVHQVNGTIMIPKLANGPLADYDVYNKYVLIRNNVTVMGYTSSGLTEIIQPGDTLLITFGYSATTALKQLSFEISEDDVNSGFHTLPSVPVTSESIVSYVAQGSILVNAALTNAKAGDYIVVGNKFIIRNGVDTLGYVSENLSENINVGDIILMYYL